MANTRITLNTGNHVLFTFVLLILILKGCAKKVSESGGRQRNKIWEVVPDKGIRIAFCVDPFVKIIEIYDHSYEQTIISLL